MRFHYFKKVCLVLSLIVFFFASQAEGQSKQPKTAINNSTKSLVDFVNPYIGNISHLLVPTYPTIHLPNSFLRVYPERVDYTTDLLRGLPLEVTSHRGSSAFNLSPYQGDETKITPIIKFSYDQEKITPYSYSVYLDDQQTTVQFAVSHQSAMYQLNFTQDLPAYLVLNSRNGALRWDGQAVTGFQSLDNNTRVYLYLQPEKAPETTLVMKDNTLATGTDAIGRNACVALKYSKGTKTIRLRYGISFISEEQAKNNLNREIKDYDLAALQETGRRIWNESLGKIEVTGNNINTKTVFYTSFYRTF